MKAIKNIFTEERIGKLVDVVVDVSGVVIPALIGWRLFTGKSNNQRVSNNYGYATYSEAVSAIMDSSMIDSRKTEAINILKTDSNPMLYASIISIVKSNMIDSRKIEAIAHVYENN